MIISIRSEAYYGHFPASRVSWQLNSSILAGSVDIYSEFASTASVDLVQTFFGSCGYAVFIAVVWNETMFEFESIYFQSCN